MMWIPTRALALAAALVFAGSAAAQPAGVQPEAQRRLRAMTDFLAAQKSFSVDARSTLEVVLDSGQKILFDHAATLSVQRPDRLRAERRGDLVDQSFVYDGRMLTLFNPATNHYASVRAPTTIEAMLDFARTDLDLVAPAGDLIYADAYAILTENMTGGFVVGPSAVDGVRCTHLAFRGVGTDWQIWIRDGARPLPCRMVITSTDVPGAPQFSVAMRNWNLTPKFDPAHFAFTPPKGARTVEFLPVQAGSELSR